jgi:peptide chain release factor 1
MAKSVKSTQKSLKSSGFSSHFSALFCAFFALFHCWRLSCSLDSLHAMKPFLRKKLETIQERLHDLEGLLSAPDIMADLQAFRGLSQEHAQVTPTAGRYARYQQIEKNIQEAKEMLQETELAELARDEIAQGEAELEKLEQELQRLLLPQDPDDERAAFIDAGNQGWHVETVSESPSEVGGYKEIVLRFARGHSHGNEASVGVYGQMRFESGGHRVQRVPVTETQGRIHTSACTVAVMPEPDPAQATLLNPADLRIDTFRASGAGGQHINKTDSAVRVVHLPTGLVAECQDGRSQHSNKAKALQVLQARLQDKERSERAAQEAATRKGLIGSGDRSDRIRTYNFPQGRMTDHRINLTLYKLLFIMEGDLAETIEALLHAREQEQLQALELGQ